MRVSCHAVSSKFKVQTEIEKHKECTKNRKKLPVTNARCSCPLNPVAHGLTVPTFLARQYITEAAAMTTKTAPPAATKLYFLEECLCGGEMEGEGLGAANG